MKLSILAVQPSSLCYVAVLGEQELKQFALCTYRHNPVSRRSRRRGRWQYL